MTTLLNRDLTSAVGKKLREQLALEISENRDDEVEVSECEVSDEVEKIVDSDSSTEDRQMKKKQMNSPVKKKCLCLSKTENREQHRNTH